GRGAFLKDETRARLLALGESRALLYATLAGTGLRPGEASRLRWCDLDLVAGTLTVPASSAKARRTQSVPLAASVRSFLARARDARAGEAGTARIFPAGTI